MLSRWQFGITTVYHFLFVPLTIGLAFTVAGFQTAWVRTGNEKYLRLTKFLGELFLINFALGVVTGIVQEFQFGMNWSAYSRYVGDIFGAPLAIEGLLAFFLESTFLGLWIFGWGRLSKRVHLATIWLVASGTMLAAYFILAANSWMQHPVGYAVNEATGRAELKDFLAVVLNSTTLVTFPHTIFAAFLTAATFLARGARWRLRPPAQEAGAFPTAGHAGAHAARRPAARREARAPAAAAGGGPRGDLAPPVGAARVLDPAPAGVVVRASLRRLSTSNSRIQGPLECRELRRAGSPCRDALVNPYVHCIHSPDPLIFIARITGDPPLGAGPFHNKRTKLHAHGRRRVVAIRWKCYLHVASTFGIDQIGPSLIQINYCLVIRSFDLLLSSLNIDGLVEAGRAIDSVLDFCL